MAEPCPSPNSDNISTSVSNLSSDTDVVKTDCTSPSPTETVCLESLTTDTNIPGPSHNKYVPSQHKLNDNSAISNKEITIEEKDLFFNKLGLDKVDECLDLSNDDRYSNSHDCDEDNWEDCSEGPEVDDQIPLQIAKDEVNIFHLNHFMCTTFYLFFFIRKLEK